MLDMLIGVMMGQMIHDLFSYISNRLALLEKLLHSDQSEKFSLAHCSGLFKSVHCELECISDRSVI